MEEGAVDCWSLIGQKHWDLSPGAATQAQPVVSCKAFESGARTAAVRKTVFDRRNEAQSIRNVSSVVQQPSQVHQLIDNQANKDENEAASGKQNLSERKSPPVGGQKQC